MLSGRFIARAQRLDILHIELVLFMAWVNYKSMTASKDSSIIPLDLVGEWERMLRKELMKRGLGNILKEVDWVRLRWLGLTSV